MNSEPNEVQRREGCLYLHPVLESFFGILVDATGTENCLHISTIGYENYAVSPEVQKLSPIDVASEDRTVSLTPKLVIFDLPMSQRNSDSIYKQNAEFDIIAKSISLLADDSVFLLTTGAAGLSTASGRIFTRDMAELGWKVLGYIELPSSDLNIGFQPLLAIFSKSDYSVLFAASITNRTDEVLVANSLLEANQESWIENGLTAQMGDFRGFRVERLRSELRALLNSENGFELYRLGDHVLNSSHQRAQQTFSIGLSDVAVSRVTHGAKRELVLTCEDEPNFNTDWVLLTLGERVLPSYFKMFMNSELGRKCLMVASSGSAIPHLILDVLMETQIPVPSLETQQNLVDTFSNLAMLQAQILRLEKELVFNPKNATAVSDDVINLLGSIGRLTVADSVKSLIRSGENKTAEFKETLSWDVKKGEKAKYIEQSALKTIAGFLNTDGGTLLVGVRDDGSIPGLSFEIGKLHKGNHDNFLLHFKNLVKTKIGERFYPMMEWSLENIDGSVVLVVKTEKGTEPVFIDDIFYVRTNPATDQLQGVHLIKYISERFKGGF
jgi:hypothetical protein